MYFAIKIGLSALIIAGISELGKRSSLFAALLASLPLTSILAMIWLYHDTGDVQKVGDLSKGIFWVLLPSLVFFIILPPLLNKGMNFWLALFISSAAMVLSYSGYVLLLARFGIKI